MGQGLGVRLPQRRNPEPDLPLAEQLRVRQDWTNDDAFFAVLQALDEVVNSEIAEAGRPTASSAAAAALVGYKLLFGTRLSSPDHGWPEGFERVEDSEAELASMGLHATGFDPILIDGIDPAAYLWGLFEMRERQAACAEVIRLQQHAAMQPRCLAVIPKTPVVPPQVGRPSPELAGVGS